ncbi:hypothetical protein J5TS1_09910 [Bacillus licheniformis]|nr:hypothetical protein J5TS1_09910 [Bacillus licheniformis]
MTKQNKSTPAATEVEKYATTIDCKSLGIQSIPKGNLRNLKPDKIKNISSKVFDLDECSEEI